MKVENNNGWIIWSETDNSDGAIKTFRIRLADIVSYHCREPVYGERETKVLMRGGFSLKGPLDLAVYLDEVFGPVIYRDEFQT